MSAQFVIVEQTAGNGVLNGQHSDGCRITAEVFKHLFEGRAANELHLLILEILVGGNIVERSYHALYRYSLHFSCLDGRLNQKSRLTVL